MQSLRDKALSGFIWSFVDKFGTMIVAFISNIVLARILSPDDFGVIGILTVFVVIAGVFTEGGFATSLIQKKNPTTEDFSTVFIWNLIISIIIFLGVFFFSERIEIFFDINGLGLLLSIKSIIIILNALNVVQHTILVKNIDFKKLAKIYLLTSIVGAIVGISLAVAGYGVWSLVIKNILIVLLNSLILWFISPWKPILKFSIESFKELFSFGSYILLINVVDKIYINIQSLIIGKYFSTTDLGFYTQAKKMEEIPVQGLSSVVNQVSFPVLAEIRDDQIRVKRAVSDSLAGITLINFPLMVMLILIAEPLFMIILTEKWLDSVIYFQILCVGGMIWTSSTTNSNVFKSQGRSDIYFKVQMIKRFVGLIIILIGLQFGILGMIISVAINAYLFYLISAYFTSKLIGYGILQQLSDIIGSLLISCIAGLIFFSFKPSVNASIFDILIFATFYIVSYTIFSVYFNKRGINVLKPIVLKLIR